MSVIFTSKDISKKLKIGKSRVREISKELEKVDYQFNKNQETRIYSEKDLQIIQMVVENYLNNQNLTTSVQNVINNLTQSLEPTTQNEQYSSEETQIIVETYESSLLNSENSTKDEFYTTEPNINYPINEKPPTSPAMAELIEESPLITQNLKIFEVNNFSVSPVKNIPVENELPDKFEDNMSIEEKLPINSEVNVSIEEKLPINSEVNLLIDAELPINSEVNVSIDAELPIDSEVNVSIDTELPIIKVLNEGPVTSNVNLHLEDEHSLATNMHLTIEDGLTLNSEMNLIKDELNTFTPEIEIRENIENNIHVSDLKLEIVEEFSNNFVSASNQSLSNQIMFEEFMSQISSLANQNEQILHQNQTLIRQNLEKDQKLEKILYSVEEKSEELQELASVIEEKDEKLEQMFEDIQIREVDRDARLMRVIRELQETKKMVAASREKTWKLAIKSLFVKPKAVK